MSVLIPFRDRVDLTKSCVASCAAAPELAYELILIDNGSEESATQAWLDEQAQRDDVCVVRVDEPFNYSRLQHRRRHASGSHLLLLNNDIEFQSNEVLQALLDRIRLPQHQRRGGQAELPRPGHSASRGRPGEGERRVVVDPGKHLNGAPVLATLTPLLVQEEFISNRSLPDGSLRRFRSHPRIRRRFRRGVQRCGSAPEAERWFGGRDPLCGDRSPQIDQSQQRPWGAALARHQRGRVT